MNTTEPKTTGGGSTRMIVLCVSIATICLELVVILVLCIVFFARRNSKLREARVALSLDTHLVPRFNHPCSRIPGIRVRVVRALPAIQWSGIPIPPVEVEVVGYAEDALLRLEARWMVGAPQWLLPTRIVVHVEHSSDNFFQPLKIEINPSIESGVMFQHPVQWRTFPTHSVCWNDGIPRTILVLGENTTTQAMNAASHRACQSLREYNAGAAVCVLSCSEAALNLQAGWTLDATFALPGLLRALDTLSRSGSHHGARLLLALAVLWQDGGVVVSQGTEARSSFWSGAEAHLGSVAELVVVRGSPSMDLQQLRDNMIASTPRNAAVGAMLHNAIREAPKPPQFGALLNRWGQRKEGEPHVLGTSVYRSVLGERMAVTVLESTFSGAVTDRVGVEVARVAS